MSLVQQYKSILDRVYTQALPRVQDDSLRSQLANLWFRMDDSEQNEVQTYSVTIRQKAN